METILRDLELDVREIKYLMEILLREPDLMLRQVAIRRINQMQGHLSVLLQEVEGIEANKTDNEIEVEKETTSGQVMAIEPVNINAEIAEITVAVVPEPEEVVEAITPLRESSSDLSDLLTLNDRFLFSRELFGGDVKKMDNVLSQLSQMESPENVMSYLSTILESDEENEIFQNFMELVKKHFN